MSLAAYDINRIDGLAPEFIPVHHAGRRFAGGEVHAIPDPLNTNEHLLVLQGADSNDVLSLAMLADAIRRQNRDVRLYGYIPYLPGARADRGEPLGAKVYADLINSMGFDRVFCIDPHSDVAPALYNNLERIEVKDFICWNRPEGVVAVVAPDAGAAKRAEGVANAIGVPLYLGSKRRDFKTMKLSGFQRISGLPRTGRILVVDDICDAGGTFVGLADAMDIDRERMCLWTTHGIYSHGALDRLVEHYSWIGCTDSHPGVFKIHGPLIEDHPELFPQPTRVAPILGILSNHLEEK